MKKLARTGRINFPNDTQNLHMESHRAQLKTRAFNEITVRVH